MAEDNNDKKTTASTTLPEDLDDPDGIELAKDEAEDQDRDEE